MNAGANGPRRAGLVLASLIVVAAVANLNLAVANVALPSIGRAFGAGQTALNLVAVGYSLGLAGSVLYLGALGDRYGRKMLLVLGMALSIPASVFASLAPSIEALFVARVLGGLAAGMAYPTTLALITALWSGPSRRPDPIRSVEDVLRQVAGDPKMTSTSAWTPSAALLPDGEWATAIGLPDGIRSGP